MAGCSSACLSNGRGLSVRLLLTNIHLPQIKINSTHQINFFLAPAQFKQKQIIFINKINQPTNIFYKELRSFEFPIALGNT
jgi:hypothetical protein